MAEVTTNQVKEMIDQLAAMTAAASITPEIVASIFEKMRILNDQEREKVIKVATEYIAEIRETGVDADKCRTNNGSNVQEELDMLGSFLEYVIIEVEDDTPTQNITTALCGSALCGYAICGTN